MTENAKRGRKIQFTSPRDQLSIRVSPETHARLRALCSLRGKKKTETVSNIIDEAFELSSIPEDIAYINSNTTEATE